MKGFLTGATGYIGRPFTRALLERGWSVTALVSRPASPEAYNLAQLGVTCAPGDVTDRASVEAAVRGAELVVHNADHYEYSVDAAGRARMQAFMSRETFRAAAIDVYYISDKVQRELGWRHRDAKEMWEKAS